MLTYNEIAELINNIFERYDEGVNRYTLESELYLCLPVDDVYVEKEDSECKIKLYFTTKYDAIKVAEALEYGKLFIKRLGYTVTIKKRLV